MPPRGQPVRAPPPVAQLAATAGRSHASTKCAVPGHGEARREPPTSPLCPFPAPWSMTLRRAGCRMLPCVVGCAAAADQRPPPTRGRQDARRCRTGLPARRGRRGTCCAVPDAGWLIHRRIQTPRGFLGSATSASRTCPPSLGSMCPSCPAWNRDQGTPSRARTMHPSEIHPLRAASAPRSPWRARARGHGETPRFPPPTTTAPPCPGRGWKGT